MTSLGACCAGLVVASCRASQECEDTVFTLRVLLAQPRLALDGTPTELFADIEMAHANSNDHSDSIADNSDTHEVSAGSGVVAF